MTFLSGPISGSFSRRLLQVAASCVLGGLFLLSPARAAAAAPHAAVLAEGGNGTSSLRGGLRGGLRSGGAQVYALRLHHLHTGESLSVVYRVGDTYLPDAMEKLNHFLRDHRTQDTADYDPKEFDLLHNLLTRLHRPNAQIDIVCGYRTPESNGYLRTLGGTASPEQTGVAEHSQHMLSKAIDIRVEGVSTRMLRNAALSLHAGGVGYYPLSQFVHVDVGPVRQWSFARR